MPHGGEFLLNNTLLSGQLVEVDSQKILEGGRGVLKILSLIDFSKSHQIIKHQNYFWKGFLVKQHPLVFKNNQHYRSQEAINISKCWKLFASV